MTVQDEKDSQATNSIECGNVGKATGILRIARS